MFFFKLNIIWILLIYNKKSYIKRRKYTVKYCNLFYLLCTVKVIFLLEPRVFLSYHLVSFSFIKIRICFLWNCLYLFYYIFYIVLITNVIFDFGQFKQIITQSTNNNRKNIVSLKLIIGVLYRTFRIFVFYLFFILFY